jgi:hypothetical protein
MSEAKEIKFGPLDEVGDDKGGSIGVGIARQGIVIVAI